MNSVEEGIIVLLLIVFLVILETFINLVVDNFVFWPSYLKKKQKANCGDKHKEI